MSNPLIVSTDELGIYLSDGSINVDRAIMMIQQAQDLCESVVSPLPLQAKGIVMRIAGRGYVTTTTSRAQQQAAGGSPMGGSMAGGGVWLSRSDKSDLRRVNGGGNVASVDMLPAGYTVSLPPWDNGAVYGSDFDFPVTP